MQITPRKMTNYINRNLWLFVNAVVVNPKFSSQTKEKLTSKVSSFKFTATIPDKFILDLDKKCGILDEAFTR